MKVSVVVPLFNKAAYVERTLTSVLTQTYTDFEVVVVDDGSSDDSAAIVRRCVDPRVRLIVQENQGASAARNRGVAEARAEWVALLDADDEWLPELLQRTMAVIEDDPALCAVFTDIRDARTNASFLCRGGGGRARRLVDYLEFFLQCEGRGMTASSVVLSKAALLRAGGFPVGVKHGEDIDTWTRLAWTGEVAYIPEILAVYHTETPDSEMKVGAANILDSHAASVASYRRWEQDGRIPAKYRESSRRFIDFMFLRYARLLTDAGDGIAARKVLRRDCRVRLCGVYPYLRAYLRTMIPRRVFVCKQFFRKLLVRTIS